MGTAVALYITREEGRQEAEEGGGKKKKHGHFLLTAAHFHTQPVWRKGSLGCVRNRPRRLDLIDAICHWLYLGLQRVTDVQNTDALSPQLS